MDALRRSPIRAEVAAAGLIRGRPARVSKVAGVGSRDRHGDWRTKGLLPKIKSARRASVLSSGDLDRKGSTSSKRIFCTLQIGVSTWRARLVAGSTCCCWSEASRSLRRRLVPTVKLDGYRSYLAFERVKQFGATIRPTSPPCIFAA